MKNSRILVTLATRNAQLAKMLVERHDCMIQRFIIDSRHFSSSDILLIASTHGIPHSFIGDEFQGDTNIDQSTLGICYDFPILPESIINQTKYGFFNIHPGELPSQAGRYPFPLIVMNDSGTFKLSLHKMFRKPDSGCPVMTENVFVNPNSFYSDWKFTSNSAALTLTQKFLSRIISGYFSVETLNMELDPIIAKQTSTPRSSSSPLYPLQLKTFCHLRQMIRTNMELGLITISANKKDIILDKSFEVYDFLDTETQIQDVHLRQTMNEILFLSGDKVLASQTTDESGSFTTLHSIQNISFNSTIVWSYS